MSESRAEYRERVIRTVGYNMGGSAPDALDADHIRVYLCANSGYPVDAINRAIADALEAGELVESIAQLHGTVSLGSVRFLDNSYFDQYTRRAPQRHYESRD